MSQFANARRTMVDNQLRTTDVTDARVLSSFGAVPREIFVTPQLQPLAYIDEAHRLTAGVPGRWLMSPSPFAKLVQLAEIGSSDRVLVVGSGSGYSVAVIAALAADVTGVEEDEALVASSAAAISDLKLANARIVAGKLTAGSSAGAPFDAILVEGAVEVLPESLVAQLAEGGRLIVIEGLGAAASARIYVKSAGLVTGRTAFNASAKLLPGFERAPEFVF